MDAVLRTCFEIGCGHSIGCHGLLASPCFSGSLGSALADEQPVAPISKHVLTFAIAVVAAWLGVHIMRRWSSWRMLLDRPNHRSMHAAPTPTGGGLVIAAVCMLGMAAHALHSGEIPTHVILAFAGGAILIAAVSWIDDLRPLSVWLRFLVHALAAGTLVWACFSGTWQITLPPLGHVNVSWLAMSAAFFWLVGMTNAYNFMDGVDGMAAGVAVVAGLSWFVLATICEAPPVGTLGLLLAAASGGFLLHNRPPARIFMGDVGSAFLGFSFGSLVLVAATVDWRLGLAGVFLVWPFVFDTFATFLRRLMRSENVLTAHREHLYQQLCLNGWSHGRVSLFYAFLASTGSVLAVNMVLYPDIGGWSAAFALPILTVGLWIFARFQTTSWESDAPPTPTDFDQRPLETTWQVTVWQQKSTLQPSRQPMDATAPEYQK